MAEAERTPVIAGIGEVLDRDNRLEPRALLVAAARAAEKEAQGLLSQVTSIDIVSIFSMRYADIGGLLAHDLGLSPARAGETAAGGEKPIRLLGEVAERIARGEQTTALIAGAESLRTRAQASRTGTLLDWGPADPEAKPFSPLDFVTPLALRYQLLQPTYVYPLYENACRHSWGQSVAAAEQESAELWSRYACVAIDNPFAWLRRTYTPAEILSDGPDNRLIAYPYRKLMVANPMVNQGCALLVTSLAAARAAGVAEEKLVYIGSGARADEPRDFLARDRYDRSTAQNAVLDSVVRSANTKIDLWELYSCFPTVPKMARRTLGLGPEVQPTLAGGLTFFGGPMNNYMSHAVAAAVRALRAGQGRTALLYGQGEFVTKHAALVLSATPPPGPVVLQDVQTQADAAADPIPPLQEDYTGPATLETFTIIYNRHGEPTTAPVLTRTATGARVVAQVPAEDAATLALLADRAGDPVDQTGTITREANGLLRWSTHL